MIQAGNVIETHEHAGDFTEGTLQSLFRRDWRNPHARLFGGFTPDFPHLLSGKEFKNENLYRL